MKVTHNKPSQTTLSEHLPLGGGGSLWNLGSNVIYRQYRISSAIGLLGGLSFVVTGLAGWRTFKEDYYLSWLFDEGVMTDMLCGAFSVVVVLLSLLMAVVLWHRPQWGYLCGLSISVVFLLTLSVEGMIVGAIGWFILKGNSYWFGPGRRTHRNISKAYRLRKKEGKYGATSK